MCKNDCEHPEQKPKDGKCKDEQIKKCHGDVRKHSCDNKGEKK